MKKNSHTLKSSNKLGTGTKMQRNVRTLTLDDLNAVTGGAACSTNCSTDGGTPKRN